MRAPVDVARLHRFIEELGRKAQGPGRIYLVGGSTALLLGIRAQTIDVDIKLDPEPKGVFEAIASLKDLLDINVELAAPDQYLPSLPGWQERSEFITRSSVVEFFHYDFYSQVMAKLLRGHVIDLADARALVSLGKVDPIRLKELFDQIRNELIRFPAVNPGDFEARVAAFIGEHSK